MFRDCLRAEGLIGLALGLRLQGLRGSGFGGEEFGGVGVYP